MEQAHIRFERENVEGLVPVGCTLSNAAGRLGVRQDPCDPAQGHHQCRVTVSSGIDHLNELGESDTEHLSDELRSSNRRLACMAHIIEPGEIVIMTEENRQEQTASAAAGANIKDQFDALPLDQKFSQLLHMEISALNDAVKYVANTSMKAFEKFGDALSDLGQKVESEAKKAVEVNEEPEVKTPPPAEEPVVTASQPDQPNVNEPVVPAAEPTQTETSDTTQYKDKYTPPGEV